MKKASLKIKRYTNNVNIINNNNIEKRILSILLYSLGVLALAYILILGNTIFNVVARQSFGAEIKNLSNEVGNLEFEYLAMSNKVDLALSNEMGFKEAKKTFAVRKSLSVLSIHQNEL